MNKRLQDNEPGGPTRMCVVCRRRFPKAELARHVQDADAGGMKADTAQTMPGRGHYHCAEPDCAERFARYRSGRKTRKGGLNVR
jgi:hypothetical protein